MRENLGGSLALQGLVGTVVIVVGEVGIELVVEVLSVGGGVEIDAFPFDRAPEPLDKGVVGGPAAPVAADAAAGLYKPPANIVPCNRCYLQGAAPVVPVIFRGRWPPTPCEGSLRNSSNWPVP